MRNIATSKLSYKEMLEILDEIELSWHATKEACDYCFPDYLLEWCKQVRLLILQKIPTKKVKANDVDEKIACEICKQYKKAECCSKCPLNVKIFGRILDICLKRKDFIKHLGREDLLEKEIKVWKDE